MCWYLATIAKSAVAETGSTVGYLNDSLASCDIACAE